MPSSLPSQAARRRPRHDPRETEREILEAAEQLLRERPFRGVTVEQVMLRTGLKRPAFYAHFKDRYDLVLQIVAHIGGELLVVAERWLEGDDPEHDIPIALEGAATVYLTHGPVLRALADAAPTDERVESAYRTLVETFVDANAKRIAAEQQSGRITAQLDAKETARALTWLVERYLAEAFGRAPAVDVQTVVQVLSHIWLATLYGDPGAQEIATRRRIA
jgi:TetR/AcrR family transcriptional regulator, ethionamide resistance regulator